MTTVRNFAQKIARTMDNIDGSDNRIESETWKTHAVAKMGAKDNVQRFISIYTASRSIEYYINRESRNTGETVSSIGTKWYGDLVSFTETPDAVKVDNSKNTIAANNEKAEKRDIIKTAQKEQIVSKMHEKWSAKYKNSNLGKQFYAKLYDFIKQINCEIDDKDFDPKHYSSKEEQTMDEVIAVIAGESSLNSKARYYIYRGIFQLDSDSLKTVKAVAKDKKLPGVDQKITLSGFANLSGEKQLDYLVAHVAYGRMRSGISEKEKISPQQLWAMIKKPKYGQKQSDLTQEKSKAINKIFNKNKIERGIA